MIIEINEIPKIMLNKSVIIAFIVASDFGKPKTYHKIKVGFLQSMFNYDISTVLSRMQNVINPSLNIHLIHHTEKNTFF